MDGKGSGTMQTNFGDRHLNTLESFREEGCSEDHAAALERLCPQGWMGRHEGWMRKRMKRMQRWQEK